MITTALKDSILQDLTSKNTVKFTINAREKAAKFNIDMETYFAIIDHFRTLQLLHHRKCMSGDIHITLTVEAFDLINHGGFHAREELLKNNIKKLNLEIQALSNEATPTLKSRLSSLLEIGANISSALQLFK